MNNDRLSGGRKAPLFYRTILLCCLVWLQAAAWCIPVFAGTPLSGFNPAGMNPDATSVSVNVSTFWADDPFTLRSILFNKWGGPYTPVKDNNAEGYWYTDAGFTWKGWRVAGFYRGEIFLNANRDTVEFLNLVKTDRELPVGRRFDAYLKAEGFSAYGIDLSKKVGLGSLIQGLDAGFTVRYLDADRIQHGIVKGVVTPTGKKTYDFDLDLDYVYDKNALYHRDCSRPDSGNGYSMDVGAVYTWRDRLEVSVLARDILGRIYWRHVPYTTAQATSDVVYYDTDGYQKFRPTIHGYEGYKNFTQKIPFKVDADAAYLAGPLKISGTVNVMDRLPLYWLGLDWSLSRSLALSSAYNFNYQMYSAGIAYRLWRFKVYSNSLSYKRTKALGLILSCGMEW